jgi:hypothetical protein
VSSPFRPEGATPGDPSVSYKTYENPVQPPIDQQALSMAITSLINGNDEEINRFAKENKPVTRPTGMDKCLIGQDYCLRVSTNLSVTWWQYGELEDLLSDEDAVRSEDGDLEVLTCEEHRELRFTPVE